MANIIIKDNVAEVLAAMKKARRRGLAAIAAAGAKNAKLEVTKVVYDTPESPNYKRTGRLRNGITPDSDDNYAYIGTNVKYAKWVELGTSKMKPRPHMAPAATNYSAEYKKLMEESFKNA